jgi:hypothetical protein
MRISLAGFSSGKAAIIYTEAHQTRMAILDPHQRQGQEQRRNMNPPLQEG